MAKLTNDKKNQTYIPSTDHPQFTWRWLPLRLKTEDDDWWLMTDDWWLMTDGWWLKMTSTKVVETSVLFRTTLTRPTTLNRIHKVLFVKKLLEFSDNYARNTAKNQFCYLDTNASKHHGPDWRQCECRGCSQRCTFTWRVDCLNNDFPWTASHSSRTWVTNYYHPYSWSSALVYKMVLRWSSRMVPTQGLLWWGSWNCGFPACTSN